MCWSRLGFLMANLTLRTAVARYRHGGVELRRTPYIMPGFSRFQELPLLGNALGASMGSKHNLEVSSLLAIARGTPDAQVSADQAGSAHCRT